MLNTDVWHGFQRLSPFLLPLASLPLVGSQPSGPYRHTDGLHLFRLRPPRGNEAESDSLRRSDREVGADAVLTRVKREM